MQEKITSENLPDTEAVEQSSVEIIVDEAIMAHTGLLNETAVPVITHEQALAALTPQERRILRRGRPRITVGDILGPEKTAERIADRERINEVNRQIRQAAPRRKGRHEFFRPKY